MKTHLISFYSSINIYIYFNFDYHPPTPTSIKFTVTLTLITTNSLPTDEWTSAFSVGCCDTLLFIDWFRISGVSSLLSPFGTRLIPEHILVGWLVGFKGDCKIVVYTMSKTYVVVETVVWYFRCVCREGGGEYVKRDIVKEWGQGTPGAAELGIIL